MTETIEKFLEERKKLLLDDPQLWYGAVLPAAQQFLIDAGFGVDVWDAQFKRWWAKGYISETDLMQLSEYTAQLSEPPKVPLLTARASVPDVQTLPPCGQSQKDLQQNSAPAYHEKAMPELNSNQDAKAMQGAGSDVQVVSAVNNDSLTGESVNNNKFETQHGHSLDSPANPAPPQTTGIPASSASGPYILQPVANAIPQPSFQMFQGAALSADAWDGMHQFVINRPDAYGGAAALNPGLGRPGGMSLVYSTSASSAENTMTPATLLPGNVGFGATQHASHDPAAATGDGVFVGNVDNEVYPSSMPKSFNTAQPAGGPGHNLVPDTSAHPVQPNAQQDAKYPDDDAAASALEGTAVAAGDAVSNNDLGGGVQGPLQGTSPAEEASAAAKKSTGAGGDVGPGAVNTTGSERSPGSLAIEQAQHNLTLEQQQQQQEYPHQSHVSTGIQPLAPSGQTSMQLTHGPQGSPGVLMLTPAGTAATQEGTGTMGTDTSGAEGAGSADALYALDPGSAARGILAAAGLQPGSFSAVSNQLHLQQLQQPPMLLQAMNMQHAAQQQQQQQQQPQDGAGQLQHEQLQQVMNPGQQQEQQVQATLATMSIQDNAQPTSSASGASTTSTGAAAGSPGDAPTGEASTKAGSGPEQEVGTSLPLGGTVVDMHANAGDNSSANAGMLQGLDPRLSGWGSASPGAGVLGVHAADGSVFRLHVLPAAQSAAGSGMMRMNVMPGGVTASTSGFPAGDTSRMLLQSAGGMSGMQIMQQSMGLSSVQPGSSGPANAGASTSIASQLAAAGFGPSMPTGAPSALTASGLYPNAGLGGTAGRMVPGSMVMNQGFRPGGANLRVCFDFAKGVCHRGTLCRFSHDLHAVNSYNSRERPLCLDLVHNRWCPRGSHCRFSHDLSQKEASYPGSTLVPQQQLSAANTFGITQGRMVQAAQASQGVQNMAGMMVGDMGQQAGNHLPPNYSMVLRPQQAPASFSMSQLQQQMNEQQAVPAGRFSVASQQQQQAVSFDGLPTQQLGGSMAGGFATGMPTASTAGGGYSQQLQHSQQHLLQAQARPMAMTAQQQQQQQLHAQLQMRMQQQGVAGMLPQQTSQQMLLQQAAMGGLQQQRMAGSYSTMQQQQQQQQQNVMMGGLLSSGAVGQPQGGFVPGRDGMAGMTVKTSQFPCTDFARGRCYRGASCRFSHNINPGMAPQKPFQALQNDAPSRTLSAEMASIPQLGGFSSVPNMHGGTGAGVGYANMTAALGQLPSGSSLQPRQIPGTTFLQPMGQDPSKANPGVSAMPGVLQASGQGTMGQLPSSSALQQFSTTSDSSMKAPSASLSSNALSQGAPRSALQSLLATQEATSATFPIPASRALSLSSQLPHQSNPPSSLPQATAELSSFSSPFWNMQSSNGNPNNPLSNPTQPPPATQANWMQSMQQPTFLPASLPTDPSQHQHISQAHSTPSADLSLSWMPTDDTPSTHPHAQNPNQGPTHHPTNPSATTDASADRISWDNKTQSLLSTDPNTAPNETQHLWAQVHKGSGTPAPTNPQSWAPQSQSQPQGINTPGQASQPDGSSAGSGAGMSSAMSSSGTTAPWLNSSSPMLLQPREGGPTTLLGSNWGAARSNSLGSGSWSTAEGVLDRSLSPVSQLEQARSIWNQIDRVEAVGTQGPMA